MKKGNIADYIEISDGIFKDGVNNIYILNSKRDVLLKLEKSKQALFQLMRSRLAFSILFATLIIYYFNNVAVGLCVGVVSFAAFEIYFRKVFLESLSPYLELSEPVPKKTIFNRSKNLPRNTLLKNIALSVLVAAIFAWNWVENKYSINYLLKVDDFNKLIESWLSILMVILPLINAMINIKDLKRGD